MAQKDRNVIWLDDELHHQLKVLAVQKQITMKQLVIKLLEVYKKNT
jgi:hypothetical protein